MSTSTHRSSAFATHMNNKPDVEGRAQGSLILRPADDGWMLVTSDGEVVFRAPGTAGRRQCLKFAQDHGVISVRS